MGVMIGSVIMSIPAIICYIISCRHFRERGFLLNNSYIYASKSARETMDKKPYYRQSGVVFLLIGVVFSIAAIDMVMQTDWLLYCELAVIAGAMVYAVISSVRLQKRV